MVLKSTPFPWPMTAGSTSVSTPAAHPALVGIGAPPSTCLFLFGLLILNVISASAAEYSATPRAQFELEYDDNPKLRADPIDSAFGAIAHLGGSLAARTETSTLRIDPLFRIRRFDSEEDLDSEDVFVDLAIEHQTPRTAFGLFVDFAYDTTNTSELATTGRVPARRRRTRIDVTPEYHYALSRRSSIDVNYTHTDTSYDDGISVRLFDFTNDVGQLTANYQLSEADAIFASLFGGRLQVEQLNRDTDSLGFNVGYTKSFSDTLDATLSLGAVASSAEGSPLGPSLSRDDTAFLFDLDVLKRFERTSVGFRAGSSRIPTSQGRLVDRIQVRLAIRHHFSPLWSGNVSAFAFQNSSLTDVTTFSDTNGVTVRVGITRRLTRQWSILGSYRYRRREDDAPSQTVDSNAVQFSIQYQWDSFTMSR